MWPTCSKALLSATETLGLFANIKIKIVVCLPSADFLKHQAVIKERWIPF
jgi:hypothetical protein